MGLIFGSCDLTPVQCQVIREQQVCFLGWALLFLWLGTILWMTREMWCARFSSPTASAESLLRKSSEDGPKDIMVSIA